MIQRMIRAARLEADFYEMVEADASYTREALIVVLVASLASGIGAGIRYGGVLPVLTDVVSGLVAWVVWSAVTLWIGTTVTRGPETRSDMGEMLRCLGYSYSPRVLAFFAFLPAVGGWVTGISIVWQLVAGIVAIRQALDFGTGRAVITVILGWFVMMLVTVVIGLLFGIGRFGG